MKAHNNAEQGLSEKRWFGRRGFLRGIGAGGLATAATVFGFAPSASAVVRVGCCTICCSPTHSLSECETGNYYVWTCTNSTIGTCYCCEHGRNPCNHGCDHNHYSSYTCS